jgi:hypothetical protein
MAETLPETAPGRDFWNWLGANTARIQSSLQRDPQGISDEIGREFDKAYPDLAWEVSPAQSTPWLFCVSANGNRDLFPQVVRAVQEAPAVPGWTIQAFRPRGSLTAEVNMGGKALGYEDVWCSVRPAGDGVAAVLWIRGLTPDSDSLLSPAALILLDNAVGEYDAVMRIVQLERGPLPQNPSRQDDFFPLAELPQYLDGLKGGPSVEPGRTDPKAAPDRGNI